MATAGAPSSRLLSLRRLRFLVGKGGHTACFCVFYLVEIVLSVMLTHTCYLYLSDGEQSVKIFWPFKIQKYFVQSAATFAAVSNW